MSYLNTHYSDLTKSVMDLVTNNPNEHLPELMGLATGINQFAHLNSSPRLAMEGAHLAQAQVFEGTTPRYFYSGIEHEYGRATWKSEMKNDGIIFKVIPKYQVATGRFKKNCKYYVIYRKEGPANHYDLMEIDTHHSSHPQFGYQQVIQNMHMLREKNPIPAGTVFAKSPNLTEDGEWCPGRETVVANMSIPEVTQDAVVFCAEALKEFTSLIVSNRSASAGKHQFFLNAYGDSKDYKVTADIDEFIHPTGLMMAMRDYDDDVAAIMMDEDSLSLAAIDPDIDKLVYSQPNSKIIDIDVKHSHSFRRQTADNNHCTPLGTDSQIRKYYNAQMVMYSKLRGVEAELRKIHGKNLYIEPALQRLFVEAEDFVVSQEYPGCRRVYRLQPLDEWNLDIRYEAKYVPNIGTKVSGIHGDKSIICHIWPKEHMPYDPVTGRRAEMISAGNTTIGRMNLGRNMEQYFNASRWHIWQDIQKLSDDDALDLLVRYTAKISPIAYSYLINATYEEIIGWVKDMRQCLRLPLPPHSPNNNVFLAGELQEEFPVHKGPVQYIDPQGKLNVTEDSVLLGEQYIILSEKTGSDGAAIADDAKAQIYGPPAKLSNSDKYSYPYRRQTTRAIGEAEGRAIWHACGPVILPRIIEQQNNPDMGKCITNSVMTSQYPTRIDSVCNDDIVKPGYSRPALLANHILFCSGIKYSDRLPKSAYQGKF